MSPAQDLAAILDDYALGERHGAAAGAATAAELLTGPDAHTTARQILADLADGNPDLWHHRPEPPADTGPSYDDGHAAGWVGELHRQAQLHLAIFADFDTVPH